MGDALDGGLEQDGRGGAIDIVVAVDEDRFAGKDGREDALDGATDAEELRWIAGWIIEKGFERGVEEVCSGGGRFDAPGDENLRYRERTVEGRRKSLNRLRISTGFQKPRGRLL